MRGFLTFAAIAALTHAPVPALADGHNGDQTAPIAAVKAFMASFDAQDADGMSAVMMDGAMVTVIEEQQGEDRLQSVPLSALIASISSSKADLKEPVWNMQAISEGPVATVTANFEFRFNGERTHCGTNIFNLVRVDGAWKIASITYSHIEEGCLDAPKVSK